MFIFPFARSYPAYKWPVGEYILPPRLLCVCERARVTSSNGVHIHSVRKESRRQRVPVGFNPWWKRGKCLSSLFFFVLSFPYGINGRNAGWEPRYKGQRILLSCSLSIFGFFRVGGSRPSPWGTRGTKGWMSNSEWIYLFQSWLG